MDFIQRSIEKSLEKTEEESLEDLLEKVSERGIFVCEKDFLTFLTGDELIARKTNNVLEVKKAEDGKAKKGERWNIISKENINEFLECFDLKDNKENIGTVLDKEKEEEEPTSKIEVPELVKEAIAVAEKRQDKLGNDMYSKLYEKLDKEFDKANDKELYLKKLKGDLKKFTTGNIDSEDEEFLKNFGFNKEDKENKKRILELYEKVISKILSELKNVEETDDKGNLEEQRQGIMKELEGLGDEGYIDKDKQEKLKKKLEKLESEQGTELKQTEKTEVLKLSSQEEIEKMSIEDLKEEIERVLNSSEFGYAEKHYKAAKEGKILVETAGSEDTEKWREQNRKMFTDYDNYLKALENEKTKKENPETVPETREGVPKNVQEIIEKMRSYKWGLQEKIVKISEENKEKLEDYNMGEDQSEEDRKAAKEVIKLKNMSKMATLDEFGAEIAASSFEENPRKRREAAEAVSEDLGNLLKTLQAEILIQQKESNRRELGGEKDKLLRNFVNVSKDRIREAISKEDDQQTEGQEEKSKFGWLKEKLGIGSENIKEMNEKISEATNLEDLVEATNLIDKKYKVFNDVFKEALKKKDRETLREYYNNDMGNIEKGKVKVKNRKEVLVKFYEKLDELLKEKEEGDNPTDTAGDSGSTETETEITPETPTVEMLDIEEVSEEVKEKIKKAFEKLGNEDRNDIEKAFREAKGFFDKEALPLWISGSTHDFLQDNKETFEGVTVEQIINIMEEKDKEEGNETVLETGEVSEKMKGKIKKGLEKLKEEDSDTFVENVELYYFNDSDLLDSEKSLEEDSKERPPFGNIAVVIENVLGIKLEEIKDIKTKDFMKVLKEIYEEVKGRDKEKKVTRVDVFGSGSGKEGKEVGIHEDIERLLDDNKIERINDAKNWNQLIREIENRKIEASAKLDNPIMAKIHEMLGIILDNFDLNERKLKKLSYNDNWNRLNEFQADCPPEIDNNKNVNKFISAVQYKISTLLAKEIN